MNSITLKDPFSVLPSEISVKIASYLPQSQISLYKCICKSWSALLNDKALWFDFNRNINWIIKDDPLINESPLKALSKNKRIAQNIDTLNFVSRDFFPCKSYNSDCEEIQCYTVWNNNLVVRAECKNKSNYLVVNDDQTSLPINYDKTDKISCMTVLHNQLIAGTFNGKIYQLSIDQSQNGEPISLYDGNDLIEYMEPFLGNLLVLTSSIGNDTLSLRNPKGHLIKAITQKADKVRIFEDKILVTNPFELIFLNDKLEILKTQSTPYFIQDLVVVNSTIISLINDFSIRCGTYQCYFEMENTRKSDKRFVELSSMLTTFHNRVISIDSEPYTTPTKFPYIRSYDIHNFKKTSKILSEGYLDLSEPKVFVNQAKVFILVGKEILELNFDI
ncbi:MAG: F-box protein [Parachlamydiales bacterium]|nr:F-box protein [Parachlamydiales bacterium]